jgi:hypothetical protein
LHFQVASDQANEYGNVRSKILWPKTKGSRKIFPGAFAPPHVVFNKQPEIMLAFIDVRDVFFAVTNILLTCTESFQRLL